MGCEKGSTKANEAEELKAIALEIWTGLELKGRRENSMGVAQANKKVFSTEKEMVTPLANRSAPFGIESPCILHSTSRGYYKALRQLYTVPWDLHMLQPMRNFLDELGGDYYNKTR